MVQPTSVTVTGVTVTGVTVTENLDNKNFNFDKNYEINCATMTTSVSTPTPRYPL